MSYGNILRTTFASYSSRDPEPASRLAVDYVILGGGVFKNIGEIFNKIIKCRARLSLNRTCVQLNYIE